MGIAKYYEDNLEMIENRFAKWELDERLNAMIVKAEEMAKLKRTQKKKTEVILCLECGRSFNFTGAEQNYYEKHKLSRPKRCAKCRERRKEMFRVIETIALMGR